ncbi:MAG: monosaccharide transporter ATP-binding protein family [Subtercola sp.]|nr:monosaccharide transporter ATP-binding protein family [Subtercola sp.]
MHSQRQPALLVRNISKTFNGNTVLSGCSIEVKSGEIHGLLGQNGSGKSTLVKILSGYQPPDAGAELLLSGVPVHFPVSSASVRDSGLAFVHQDLALVDELSVLDNLFVGRYGAGLGRPVPTRRLAAQARSALAQFGMQIDPGRAVSTLSSGDKACLAIVRAFLDVDGHESPALVLDEPTARLDRAEVERLFTAMRAAAARGAGILFISHRLDEILTITDRVTALRGGVVTGEANTANCDEDSLIELILGERLSSIYPPSSVVPGAPALTVAGLTGDTVLGLDLEIRAGEVVGLTGLPDSGADAVPYLLMGSRRATASAAELDGATFDVARMPISQRIRSGLALVPGDRAEQGAALGLTVSENVSLLRLREFVRFTFLNPRKQRTEVGRLLADFDVRPQRPNAVMGVLSGGNQQKAVMAKTLATAPKVVILHEPTQGVDVGARRLIFQIVADLSAQGTAVLLVSVEHEDLARLSHRVIVMRNGVVGAELSGDDLVKERIAEECLRTG